MHAFQLLVCLHMAWQHVRMSVFCFAAHEIAGFEVSFRRTTFRFGHGALHEAVVV